MNEHANKLHSIAKPGLIISASVALGIIFNYLFFGQKFGINFFILVSLIICGLYFLSYQINRAISKEVAWLLVPLIFFSAMVFVRASELLTFLNVVLCIFILLLICKVSFGQRLSTFLAKDYANTFLLPIEFLNHIVPTLKSARQPHQHSATSPVTRQILRGVLIAAPVLFIFVLLFSSSDLVFRQYVDNIFSFNIGEDLIARFITTGVVSAIFIGAFSFTIKGIPGSTSSSSINNLKLSSIESNILLGSVNLLFFAFICVQLTYFFGGEANISSQGFTYAEYARKGFFELIAVAVMSLILLLAGEKYSNPKDHSSFRIFSTLLIAQVAIIMISAFNRLSLYEEAYGFTVLRLFSHMFILLLAVIFTLFLIKLYRKQKENFFYIQVFLATVLFVGVLNVLNPDAFIARQNIKRYYTTGKLDGFHLTYLSDDAIPEIVKGLDIPDKKITKNIRNRLHYKNLGLAEDDYGWQSYNISTQRAKNILSDLELKD